MSELHAEIGNDMTRLVRKDLRVTYRGSFVRESDDVLEYLPIPDDVGGRFAEASPRERLTPLIPDGYYIPPPPFNCVIIEEEVVIDPIDATRRYPRPGDWVWRGPTRIEFVPPDGADFTDGVEVDTATHQVVFSRGDIVAVTPPPMSSTGRRYRIRSGDVVRHFGRG